MNQFLIRIERLLEKAKVLPRVINVGIPSGATGGIYLGRWITDGTRIPRPAAGQEPNPKEQRK